MPDDCCFVEVVQITADQPILEVEIVVAGEIDTIELGEAGPPGPPGPPGSAENIAEIVPSPILSFENALL